MSNKKHKCCTNTYFYSSESEFPNKGKEDILYVDKSSGISYIWDTENTKYLQQSSGMNTVESVNDLRSLLPTSTDNNVYVLGHYEDIPGVGGGMFWWDETSNEDDNNGTIIKVNGINNGRWKRSYSGDVKLEWFGVVYDDPSYAAINSEVINNVLNINEPVIIEGEIFLSPSGSNVTAQHIVIRGGTNKSRVIVTSSGGWFTPTNCRSLQISGISFKSISGLFYIANRPIGKVDIEFLNITNCVFEGAISLRLGETNNFNTKIKNVSINNNWFYESPNSFFRFTETEYETIQIYENNIRNFKHVFFHITSTHEDYKYRGKVFIKNNVVINDDDLYMEGGVGSYYCFVLMSGNYCEYSDNYVEGLKSVIYKPLYDIYGSAKEMKYFNNEYVNNIDFSGGGNSGSRTLMKIKGSKNYTAYNNKFIIKKEFLEKFIADNPEFNLSIEDCYVSIASASTSIDSGEHLSILDNVIDVYHIKGRDPRFDELETVVRGNKISCDILTDTTIFQIYPTNLYKRYICISDNIFNVRQPENSSSVSLIRHSAGSENKENINMVVENNILNGKFSGIIENINTSGYIHVSNNKIESTSEEPFDIAKNCKANEFVSKQNNIQYKNILRSFWGSDFKFHETDNIFSADNNLGGVLSLGVPINKSPVGKSFSKDISLLVDGYGGLDLTLYFTLKVDSNSYVIEYTNPISGVQELVNITSVINTVSHELFTAVVGGNIIGNFKLRTYEGGSTYIDIHNIPSIYKLKIKEIGL